MEFEELSVWYICHSSEVCSSSNQNEIMSSHTLQSVHINKMLPQKQRLGGGGSNFHDFWQREEVGVKYLPVVQQLAIWRIHFEI